MEPDYNKLGFKCGIEIHQQLETHKLFCSCPSVIRDEQPDLQVERRMRAVAGELGDVDPAALHEFLRNRTLIYEAYADTNCLIELDEEPPHPLNREALRTVLEVALLLKARPVDEIHVMRKTVIDGSNTSGFQRTMLVAEDGVLETSLGPVGIPTICLEEDAARIISERGGVVHYRLDRLGIPLIEIATAPDIKNPRHAREVAEKLGSILRASRVKRGLGTIRQDINVSIREGNRIEVKGVQDLSLISKVVEGEVRRQATLVEVKKGLAGRGVKSKDYEVKSEDVTAVFKGTKSSVIKGALHGDGVVLAVKLAGLSGLLKGRLGPQLAQYARALAGVAGIFHGDELPAHGISPAEVEAVVKKLKVRGDDSYAVVAAPKRQAEKALEAVLDRCKTAVDGVPDETRRARDEGTTEYMRPLPGSSRMYPETDEPLVPVTDELVEGIRAGLPELREDKALRYEREWGLNAELAGQLSRSGKTELVEGLVSEYPNVTPVLITSTCTSMPKEAAKRYNIDASSFTDSHYTQVIDLLNTSTITPSVRPELFSEIAGNPGKPVKEIAKEAGLTTVSGEELKKIAEKVVSENKGLKQGQLMGEVMAEVKGRADPKEVAGLIKALRRG
jgi:glutamyl-tRNA(Gln) amidotransferase subunit E